MIPYTIINKKEQAINLCYKYFNSYDTFYYNNQKGTSNNFVLEIFKPKKFLKTKRNTQRIYTRKLLFSFFVIHRHAVKHIITLCIPKLL